MDRKGLDIKGLPVRFYEDGQGPPLLLVHGAGATARLWHRQMGPLSAHFRVIAPDLPGFGGTGLFPWIGRVRDYAVFLSEFLHALGAGRASVVGSSMGGWTACWFALDYTLMLDRLVLISPAGLFRDEEPPMPLPRLMQELERYYAAALPAGEVRLKTGKEFERAAGTMETLAGKGAFTPDLAGRLSGIRAKTLVMWGTEDRVVPVSYASDFKASIPGSEVRLIKGAGHLPFVERAQEVNEIVSSFLLQGKKLG